MKKRVSYQDFQRRQKLAEADLQIAERVWQRDIEYIKEQGVKKTIIDEVKDQIVPPKSFLGRIITPSKRRSRGKSSLLDRLLGGFTRSTDSPLTRGDYASEVQGAVPEPTGRTQQLISTGLAIARPILWTVGLSIAKGYLRRKFKPLRLFIR